MFAVAETLSVGLLIGVLLAILDACCSLVGRTTEEAGHRLAHFLCRATPPRDFLWADFEAHRGRVALLFGATRPPDASHLGTAPDAVTSLSCRHPAAQPSEFRCYVNPLDETLYWYYRNTIMIDTKKPAPRCYCGHLTVCDFCSGYRHPTLTNLSCPREMRLVAEILGRSTKEISRMSGEQIVSDLGGAG